MRSRAYCLTIFLLLSALIATLSACKTAAPTPAPSLPTPTEIPQATTAPTVTPEPSPTPGSVTETPAPPEGEHHSLYSLFAALDYPAHFLSVEERIHYANTSGDTLTELVLMVEASYYPGVFDLKSITWQDGAPVDGLVWETGMLRFPLRQPLLPGGTRDLTLVYEMTLPSPQPSAETRPIPFGYTARQINLVDWYPFVPPYRDGEGWIAHRAGFFGEHLAYDLVDFEIGLQIESGGLPLVVAASAAASVDGNTYSYLHENARSFALSISPEYQLFSSEVDGVQVLSYAFPFHDQAGEAVLEATAQALALFTELFGPYPRDLITAVEADFLDGMEYDGMYFLSNGFYNLYQNQPGDYLIAIAAHETAHQWFYGMVGNDQALEPWLDEALCTYTERLYYERYYPEALDWWWAYRVNYYEPRGWIDGSIYNPDGYRAYRDAVYLNGAVYLEKLRQTIGDEAFFAFLRDYVRQSRGKIATAADFFSILAEHSQVNLQGLNDQFFSPD